MNKQTALKTQREPEHRVIALLDREQVDYLDRVGKDAMFSTGSKLSRTKIISAAVDMMKDLHISGEGIKTSEELEQRVLDAMKKDLTGEVIKHEKEN